MEKTVREKIKEKFGSVILDEYVHNDRRTYISVDKTEVPAICRFLYEELGGRLCIATGTDTRSGIEIHYQFMFPAEHLVLTLKTKLDKPNPEIESVGAFYPAAEWIERELHDILGVTVTNHPDPRRFLMSDDWPEDVYPLRRDFNGLDEEQIKVRCMSGECDT